MATLDNKNTETVRKMVYTFKVTQRRVTYEEGEVSLVADSEAEAKEQAEHLIQAGLLYVGPCKFMHSGPDKLTLGDCIKAKEEELGIDPRTGGYKRLKKQYE